MEIDKDKKILKINNIVKTFGGLYALNGVSLSLEEHDIFGIVGPNGAGKTTLFNIISGLLKPSSGSIIYNSRDITRFSAHTIAKMGIGRTFQVVRPFSFMSVLENVMAAYGIRFYSNIIKSFYGWRKEKYIRQAEEVLQKTDLIEYENRKAETLPLGIQRRLEIARALLISPKLLLLDESFSGLSFSEMDELKKLVKNINKEGITIIIIEHNMPIVMDLCSNVVVLNYGEKLAEGKPKDIVKNPDVIEAYIGKKYA